MQAERNKGPVEPGLPLFGGGDGGTSGGMEARLAKLEAHMEHVLEALRKLAPLPERLATLDERVDHLPGKGFVVTAAMGTIAGVVALMGLLQHLGFLH